MDPEMCTNIRQLPELFAASQTLKKAVGNSGTLCQAVESFYFHFCYFLYFAFLKVGGSSFDLFLLLGLSALTVACFEEGRGFDQSAVFCKQLGEKKSYICAF